MQFDKYAENHCVDEDESFKLIVSGQTGNLVVIQLSILSPGGSAFSFLELKIAQLVFNLMEKAILALSDSK